MDRRIGRIAVAAAAILVLSSCTTTLAGQPVSVYDDPFHVAGMDATDGPNGVRDDAPESDREVENTDGGEVDEVSAMAVSDIEEFWEQYYSEISDDDFQPIESVQSWDSTDPDSEACGDPAYGDVNAYFCGDVIAWDRGVFMPSLQEMFGDMALVGVLAHEYGHAVQYEADLVSNSDSTLVWEQQADCFEGAYTRWVAEGDSSRFTVNTADGLNKQLANLVIVRDETLREDDYEQLVVEGEHGNAFERISAYQVGFTDGVAACAAIDEEEIEQRRGDMPLSLPEDKSGEL